MPQVRSRIGLLGIVVVCAGFTPPDLKDDGSQDLTPPATADKPVTAPDKAKERVDTIEKGAKKVKDTAVGGSAATPSGDSKPAKASELPASKRPAKKPGAFPVPAKLPAHARFVLVDLHEEVSLGMAAFVKRVVGTLEADDILVLDINTFGGRVDAAVQIRDALLGARERRAWTVAYVHPRAISAGALISYACDLIIVAPGSTMGAATPISVEGGKAKAVGEKYVSYMRQEMHATAQARGRDGLIAEAMVDADVEVDGLIDKGKLLTLNGQSALQWRVASFEADNLDALIARLGYDGTKRTYTTKTMKWSWAEKFAGWLSSSMISGLLMTIGMLGLMIGLYTGGNPLPLALGGVCLAMFFFGHHVVNLAGIEELVLFALGLGLILFEVTVPGHILPGIVGLVLVVGSLVMGLINVDTVPVAIQWNEGWITRALATVFGSILATTMLMYATFKILPETKFGKSLALPAVIDGRATDGVDAENEAIVGLEGEAVTELRPSGKVKVAGKRYEAISRQGYIAAGEPIKVTGTRGFSVVVAKLEHPIQNPETEEPS